MKDVVLVLDFGGQYKELIARRVREKKVLSIIKNGATSLDEIREINPKGIILTGGPNSVYAADSPKCSKELFDLGIPVLGICYGMQLMCYVLGGTVSSCDSSEYGVNEVELSNCALFDGMAKEQKVLMSHTDYVSKTPKGFVNAGTSANCPCVATYNQEKKLYGVQFHPEVELTKCGEHIFDNFVFNICKAEANYTMEGYIEKQIAEIKEKVGNKKVLLALSGGVDSSVCAALLSKAIPSQLVCVFVDHGFMRKNEGEQIESVFSKMDLHFVRANCQDRFLAKLKGVTDTEQKRKLIGAEFIKVFEEYSQKFEDIEILAQGTIYPDVIESGSNNSANIKSHHNVGGLPKNMKFTTLVEPLRGLFKDEVRAVGKMLGLPESLVQRQPFPGPGLAIRIIGEVTKEKLDILRDADYIFREEIERNNVNAQQYFAVLTSCRSVGVMGDFRTYDYVLALRAVNTTDFMTADFVRIPYDVLAKAAVRIANEVQGVSRVVYDVSGKPPATIEWE